LCRYVVLALCTGYHPVGYRGEWIIISVEDADTLHITVPMVPVRVNIVLAVKELVPFDLQAVDTWQQRLLHFRGSPGKLGAFEEDVRRATVLLKDRESGEQHQFLAVPLEQEQLVDVWHVLSGALPRQLRGGLHNFLLSVMARVHAER
jgi:hypothetical protein